MRARRTGRSRKTFGPGSARMVSSLMVLGLGSSGPWETGLENGLPVRQAEAEAGRQDVQADVAQRDVLVRVPLEHVVVGGGAGVEDGHRPGTDHLEIVALHHQGGVLV